MSRYLHNIRYAFYSDFPVYRCPHLLLQRSRLLQHAYGHDKSNALGRGSSSSGGGGGGQKSKLLFSTTSVSSFHRSVAFHASSTEPIVLEKPDKFRPPSHPSRLANSRRSRQYPGPPLPESEKKAQMTRKYPHMFPKEGTFMFWFLTNRMVHVYITLVRSLLSTRGASCGGGEKAVDNTIKREKNEDENFLL